MNKIWRERINKAIKKVIMLIMKEEKQIRRPVFSERKRENDRLFSKGKYGILNL